MLKQRVLVIGKGHLGGYLKSLWQLPDELHWTREMAELDPTALVRLRPDAVVNAAGKTNLSWCEENAAECFRCNVSAPLGVLRAVKAAFGARVPYLHLSSGCVWDGPYRPDGKPFQPGDPPTPACFYSWTKAACDALMLRENAGNWPLGILRPRQVYSPLPSQRNTLAKLCGYPKLLDTPNSMTSADTIAKTIEALLGLEPGNEHGAWNRILNVYERGVTSPYEVGAFLAQAGCRKPPERLAKTNLDSWHKPKRVDTVIEDALFEKLVNPPAVQDELKRNIAVFARVSSSVQCRTSQPA